MEQNKYREAMELVTTPPEVKEKTRRMLQARTARRKSALLLGGLGTLAAAIVVAVGLIIWMRMEEGVPDLNPSVGAYTETDTLPVDELNFISLTTDALTPPIMLSPVYQIRRSLPLEDYQDLFPTKIPGCPDAPDGSITAFSSAPSDVPDAITGRFVYQTIYGGTLTVAFTDNPTMLYVPLEIGGSIVSGVPVGVGSDELQGTYYGAYRQDSFTVLLTAEGIQESEFVELLRLFASK